MTGHQAIIAAAKRAGCTFVAGRPSSVVEPLLAEAVEKLERPPQCATASGADALVGIFRHRESPRTEARKPNVVLAEDDIAAAGSCIAAAAAGAIPLLVTSGTALAACRENIALAQLAELPLVIVHCQHLGSADGGTLLAGDTDVTLARHVALAGLPLPVLAAADAASACQLTHGAFDIAQRLRTPVILLTSYDIGASEQALDTDAILSLANAESNMLATDARVSFEIAPRPGFVQFAGTVNGQRVFLSIPPDEIEARLSRLRDKILNAAASLEFVRADIDPDAETLVLSYGLADQAARQVVVLVRKTGASVSHLTIHSLWPMPQQAFRRALTPFIRRVLIPELNLGLYAGELRRVICNVKIESLARHDGRLIEPVAIARRITDWPCG